MLVTLFIEGLAAGLIMSLPVGPIGVLCVRRTLSEGRLSGLVSGLGASVADTLYAGMVGFGLTWLFAILENKEALLQFVGGAFLCFLGIRIYVSRPAQTVRSVSIHNLMEAFTSTFAITLSNPVTLIGMLAILASRGVVINGDDQILAASVLMMAVFIGSAIWWIGISLAAGLMRDRLDAEHMKGLNRFSGVLITSFGAIALLQLMWSGQAVF